MLIELINQIEYLHWSCYARMACPMGIYLAPKKLRWMIILPKEQLKKGLCEALRSLLLLEQICLTF